MTSSIASVSPRDPAETLRPEARPLPYSRLDPQQQTALTRIVSLLTAATTDAAAALETSPSGDATRGTRGVPAPPSGPYVESARSSRNLLVSGERGTGKTTLMLSLASTLTSNEKPDETIPQPVIKADQ